jgi:hypothetical protein
MVENASQMFIVNIAINTLIFNTFGFYPEKIVPILSTGRRYFIPDSNTPTQVVRSEKFEEYRLK